MSPRFIALILACAGPASAAPAKSPRIEPLNDQSVVEGCGCWFKAKSDPAAGVVFFQKRGGTGPATALMNLKGTDRPLREVRSVYSSERLDPGTTWSATFRTADTKARVVIQTAVTAVCPEGLAGCETFTFEGRLRLITSKTRVETVSIRGECGC